MKYLLMMALLVSSGCTNWLQTATPGVLPYVSLEMCDEVNYARKGTSVEIQAKCRTPLR